MKFAIKVFGLVRPVVLPSIKVCIVGIRGSPNHPCVVVGKSDFTLFLMETAKYFDFIN
jgi:hypothetical protein